MAPPDIHYARAACKIHKGCGPSNTHYARVCQYTNFRATYLEPILSLYTYPESVCPRSCSTSSPVITPSSFMMRDFLIPIEGIGVGSSSMVSDEASKRARQINQSTRQCEMRCLNQCAVTCEIEHCFVLFISISVTCSSVLL